MKIREMSLPDLRAFAISSGKAQVKVPVVKESREAVVYGHVGEALGIEGVLYEGGGVAGGIFRRSRSLSE